MVGLQSQVLKVIVSVERGEGSFLLSTIVSWTGSNPSANVGSDSEDAPLGSEFPRRGRTAPQKDVGASLGYPFEIIRMLENFKI